VALASCSASSGGSRECSCGSSTPCARSRGDAPSDLRIPPLDTRRWRLL
jgi:hypothetical protein